MKRTHRRRESGQPYTTRNCLASMQRNGVTLTEVLMSLMIMGVGVVSLATLFPIASLRVLEATNLTNSTIVRFNAEGLVDSFRSMVDDPDGISSTSDEDGRHFVVDPLGWYEHEDQLGIASVTDPRLIFFEYNRPSTVTLPRLTTSNGNPLPTRYFGENRSAPEIFTSLDITRQIVSLPDTTTDIAEAFPDPDGSATAAYVPTTGQVTGIVMPADVDLSIVALEPSLYQAVIFDKTGKYSETRTLTAVSGQQISWATDLNGDGDALDPGESEHPLPSRFGLDAADTTNGTRNIGLVKIEQPVPYYSWLLSVQKDINGPVNVDVVVFNKREFSQLSEQIYLGDLVRFRLGPDGQPGTAGIDDNGEDKNGNGSLDAGEDTNNNGRLDGDGADDIREIGYRDTDDFRSDTVTVDWDPSLYPGGTSDPVPKPPLRRGGYIYDPVNGLWYRIREIESSPTATSAVVALETLIVRNNTEDLSLDGTLGDLTGEDRNNNGTLDRGGVIIPRGVIAVFPLKTK